MYGDNGSTDVYMLPRWPDLTRACVCVHARVCLSASSGRHRVRPCEFKTRLKIDILLVCRNNAWRETHLEMAGDVVAREAVLVAHELQDPRRHRLVQPQLLHRLHEPPVQLRRPVHLQFIHRLINNKHEFYEAKNIIHTLQM